MYDYAKVYQSVCGYDFVLLDRTRCDAYVKSMREFADAELSQRLGAEGLRHLRVVTASVHTQIRIQFSSFWPEQGSILL